jgi:hypothetical protein
MRTKSGYSLRCLGESNNRASAPSTDSPFRWAKRQAKITAQAFKHQPPASVTVSTNTIITATSAITLGTAVENTTAEVTVAVAEEVELDAAGDRRATAEDAVIVVESAALQPYSNATEATTEYIRVTQNLTSSTWSDVYFAIESFRRLCLHHPALVSSDLNKLLPAVCQSAKALRSSVARNSLLALRDAFVWTDRLNTSNPLACCTNEMLRLVVVTLLEQGAADKSFLRQAAQSALQQICSQSFLAHATVFASIAKHVNHKRARFVGLGGKYSVMSLRSLPAELVSLMEQDVVSHMLRTFSKLLTVKDSQGRQCGKEGLTTLSTIFGKQQCATLLRAALPSHEVAKALSAAGIMKKKAAPKRISLKEKMKMMKMQMAARKNNNNNN